MHDSFHHNNYHYTLSVRYYVIFLVQIIAMTYTVTAHAQTGNSRLTVFTMQVGSLYSFLLLALHVIS